MRQKIQAQAFRRFDVPCHAYLRDDVGPLPTPAAELQVEAIPYTGQAVVESWPASIAEHGRLEWTVPTESKLHRELYQLRVRAGNQLLGLGLLEVV